MSAEGGSAMLAWLKELKPEDAAARIDQAWGNVLQTEDGQIVVGTLLDELGLLEPIASQDAVTRHNVAVMVLKRIHRSSTPRVLEALVKGGD